MSDWLTFIRSSNLSLLQPPPIPSQSYRIAMCTLHVLIERRRGHLRNRVTIGGRYGTRFESSFIVKPPIVAKRITNVDLPTQVEIPEVDISLDAVLKGPETLRLTKGLHFLVLGIVQPAQARLCSPMRRVQMKRALAARRRGQLWGQL